MVDAIRNFFRLVCDVLGCGCELVGYASSSTRALLLSRAVLAARLIAAESQLAACRDRIQQKQDPRPRFPHAFRLLWIVLSKLLARPGFSMSSVATCSSDSTRPLVIWEQSAM